MMREARPPHSARGSLRACSRCCAAAAPRWLLAVVLLLCAIPQPAHAQDPSVLSTTPGLASSFPKQQGGILGGPVQKIDRSKPLYLQGDELIYDTKGNKIRARGNVEIFYNNYILKADEVQYDQTAGTLTAIGNVELTRAERQHRPRRALHAERGFPRRLHPVAERRHQGRHPHRRRAGDAARRQCHRIREGQVHALQERRRHAAAVVPQRREDRPRSGECDHHLPGRILRDLRPAGVVPAATSSTPTRA